ncbi:VanZ family protein [Phenylobacterium sp.]|uniref:VanZ family protein n=1 Tax=Phenylobacterium sp. TaxID=1871053 RepID=UPI003BA9F585
MERTVPPKILARGLLLLAALVCGIGMVGPFQGAEQALVPWDKAAHFMAFYGLTILLFSAFPTRRRLDLAVLAIFAGAAIEVAQTLTGRDGEIGDLCADALGALAVLAPVWLEHLRFPRVERRISALRQVEPQAMVREAA